MPGISGFAEKVKEQKPIKSMAKGGMVKKTGLYRLHKGEFVMNKQMTDKVKKGK